MAVEARMLAIPYVVKAGDDFLALIRRYNFKRQAFMEFIQTWILTIYRQGKLCLYRYVEPGVAPVYFFEEDF